MTTNPAAADADRNSKAVGTLRVTRYGDFLGVKWNRPQAIHNGQAIYTTPPATIPVSVLEELVERWAKAAPNTATAEGLALCHDHADELAQLARSYVPETSEKSHPKEAK